VSPRLCGSLFDSPDDRSHRHLTDLVSRLMDRRERGVPQGGERGVVTADE